MIRTAVVGAAGRMGRMLVKEIVNSPALELVGALEYSECPLLGQDAGTLAGLAPTGVLLTADREAVASASDVLIDFTFPQVTMPMAELALPLGKAMVIGTTGLTTDNRARLRELATQAPIVCSTNMSVGVNLLFHLCAEVAPLLGEDFDIEVVEMHHNQKKDAPSGTAVTLGEILAKARGLDYDKDTRHGRVGLVGARTKREIGMHSLRGGDVVGDHTVIFAGDGERIELAHKASSRATFARGAVRAAQFLATAKPGFYDMQDVLGLR